MRHSSTGLIRQRLRALYCQISDLGSDSDSNRALGSSRSSLSSSSSQEFGNICWYLAGRMSEEPSFRVQAAEPSSSRQAPPTQIFGQLPLNHRLRMALNITQSMILNTDRLPDDKELCCLLGDNGFVIDASPSVCNII